MIRQCKLCGKEVDFDVPWCDHETMEESAWLDINSRYRTISTPKPETELDYFAEIFGCNAAKVIEEQFEKFLK